MTLTIMQTVWLKDGRKCKVVEFGRWADGERSVVVGYTNEMGEYWKLPVKREDLLVTQEATII